jgi:hypothetical protein
MLPRYAAMIPTLVSKPFHRDGWERPVRYYCASCPSPHGACQ